MPSIVRTARVGFELIDPVRRGAIVAFSRVTVPAQPHVEGFLVPPARWVFEDLADTEATFLVEADGYIAQEITIAPSEFPAYRTVPLAPAPTYPFPSSVARIRGQVFMDRDGSRAPIEATVIVSADGSVQTIPTIASQYVAFFEPSAAGPTARCDIAAEATIDGRPLRAELLGFAIEAGENVAPPLVLVY